MTARIVVDGGTCTGHGRCYSLAPDLFVDDEEGHGHAAGDGAVATEQEELALRVVRACPERAIELQR